MERLATCWPVVAVLFVTMGCPSEPGEAPAEGPCTEQAEFTGPIPLLNADGSLNAWGWGRHPYMQYDRERVAESVGDANKEWEFWGVMTPEFTITLTMADISWAILIAVDFVHFQTGEKASNVQLGIHPEDLTLPLDSYGTTHYTAADLSVSFEYSDATRTLAFHFPSSVAGPEISGVLIIDDDPTEESLSASVPFDGEGLFNYENKVFALPAHGEFTVDQETYALPEGESFGVLDWVRGAWPEEFEWGWGYAGGYEDGKRVGFNIGFGDADEACATGNAFLHDGVLHKLHDVEWTYDPEDVMQPWTFASDDGRFQATLEPFWDKSTEVDMIVYYVEMANVLGRASGTMELDDGTVVEFHDLLASAEHASQQW